MRTNAYRTNAYNMTNDTNAPLDENPNIKLTHTKVGELLSPHEEKHKPTRNSPLMSVWCFVRLYVCTSRLLYVWVLVRMAFIRVSLCLYIYEDLFHELLSVAFCLLSLVTFDSTLFKNGIKTIDLVWLGLRQVHNLDPQKLPYLL